MPRAPVTVFVLDPGIRESDVPIVVRQLVLPRPASNLFRLTIRPAVAVLLAAIALVQKALIITLQLVVEDDATNPTTLPPEALLSTLVGAIDLRVVRQLARFPETRMERLAGFVTAAVALVPIRLEQVPAAVSEDNSAVVRAEWRRVQQTLLFEVALGSPSVVAAVVEIAFGYDAEGSDGSEHLAFGAVDLVHAIAISHWPTLPATWQVKVLHEHVARVTIACLIAFAAPTAAAAASVAEVVAVAVV